MSISTATGAAFHDGNDLKRYCEYQRGFYSGICLGLVTGASDAFARANESWICYPEKISAGDTIRVVQAFLEKHPDRLHLPAWRLIHQALIEEFAC